MLGNHSTGEDSVQKLNNDVQGSDKTSWKSVKALLLTFTIDGLWNN
jgi:hypothetical protein